MKLFLLSAFIVMSSIVYCQPVLQKLEKVKTLDDANDFIAHNAALKPEIDTISTEIEAIPELEQLLNKNAGSISRAKGHIYKVLTNTSELSFKASYIYLDGSVLTMPEIDSLRKLILVKYKAGSSFSGLAKTYTMDGNATGELDWFKPGMMMKEFEDAVKTHQKGDIFKVDIPSKKWYYVVKKTFDNRATKTAVVLRVNIP